MNLAQLKVTQFMLQNTFADRSNSPEITIGHDGLSLLCIWMLFFNLSIILTLDLKVLLPSQAVKEGCSGTLDYINRCISNIKRTLIVYRILSPSPPFCFSRGRRPTWHYIHWRCGPRTTKDSTHPQVLLSLWVLFGAQKHKERDLRAYAGFRATHWKKINVHSSQTYMER